jgi:hypothetical protein
MTRCSFPSLRSKTLDFHKAVERTKLSGAFPRMDRAPRHLAIVQVRSEQTRFVCHTIEACRLLR